MNSVKAAMFLGSADPTMDEVLNRDRQGSSRFDLFWGNFCFSFWRKSLIELSYEPFPGFVLTDKGTSRTIEYQTRWEDLVENLQMHSKGLETC